MKQKILTRHIYSCTNRNSPKQDKLLVAKSTILQTSFHLFSDSTFDLVTASKSNHELSRSPACYIMITLISNVCEKTVVRFVFYSMVPVFCLFIRQDNKRDCFNDTAAQFFQMRLTSLRCTTCLCFSWLLRPTWIFKLWELSYAKMSPQNRQKKPWL